MFVVAGGLLPWWMRWYRRALRSHPSACPAGCSSRHPPSALQIPLLGYQSRSEPMWATHKKKMIRISQDTRRNQGGRNHSPYCRCCCLSLRLLSRDSWHVMARASATKTSQTLLRIMMKSSLTHSFALVCSPLEYVYCCSSSFSFFSLFSSFDTSATSLVCAIGQACTEWHIVTYRRKEESTEHQLFSLRLLRLQPTPEENSKGKVRNSFPTTTTTRASRLFSYSSPILFFFSSPSWNNNHASACVCVQHNPLSHPPSPPVTVRQQNQRLFPLEWMSFSLRDFFPLLNRRDTHTTAKTQKDELLFLLLLFLVAWLQENCGWSSSLQSSFSWTILFTWQSFSSSSSFSDRLVLQCSTKESTTPPTI